MARVVRIHALLESIGPACAAFTHHWPETECIDLVDTSLSSDRHNPERATAIARRVQALAEYALSDLNASAILFTCSAFGHEIETVRRRCSEPVYGPNEAAFDIAVQSASRICLLTTFEPSRDRLAEELKTAAERMGRCPDITAWCEPRALAALQAGDELGHDRMLAEAAEAAGPHDLYLLGQYSMARAAPAVASAPGTGGRVLTTPGAAVVRLRAAFKAAGVAGRSASSQPTLALQEIVE